jgi:hypothetical protein
VYRLPSRRGEPLRPERLDVTGFVGVAPRGPVDEPAIVQSWSEYRWVFGDVQGPGLLGHAVRAFFAQGGARAVVLRVSPLPRWPDPAALAAVARHDLVLAAPDTGRALTVAVLARNEGTWGADLSVSCAFDAVQRFTATARPGPADGFDLDLPDGVALPPGSLLRLRGPGLPAAGAFAWTGPVAERDAGIGVRRRVAPVRPVTPVLRPLPVDVEVAVVLAAVTVVDHDPRLRREERFTDLGLDPAHPRSAADVLRRESRLVSPGEGWAGGVLPPDALLSEARSLLAPGLVPDRWAGIGSGSFGDDRPPQLFPVGGDEWVGDDDPAVGMDRMALVTEIGLLTVPDLLWRYAVPRPVVDRPPRAPEPVFATCAPAPEPVVYAAPPAAALLDGGTEQPEILRRQRRLVEHAERQRRFVALLDVPPRLPVRAVARWRSSFDSSYSAAYHPWLGVMGPDVEAVEVPPSAFAAGIVADREQRLGIPWGPANALAVGAVTTTDPVSDVDHDRLHLLGVDVFRAERDGFRLSSARTLAADPDYRQLSVRRLMTMLRLVLERQTQWLVFEPNSTRLQGVLRAALTQLLRELYRGGAFVGETEADAFFVRCGEGLNPDYSRSLGRLVAEVGVAPAQPLEYLVLRINADADGGLGVEG